MDILLIILGFICMIVGLLGSFLPVLPGPPISWVGLLLLYLTKTIPNDWTFLGITLLIAIVIVILDYAIPAMGTKKFGGSKYGVIGTTIGLVVSMIFPVLGFLGIIIWPFVGAFIGEMMYKANHKTAAKAAFGSFLGFVTGTLLKFIIAVVYFGLFIRLFWQYKEGFI
ncbi:conserved hypothetical membrane protein NMA1128 (DUF456) [Formosa agariphila KMM 3901]|uniref:Conserved hypothetical membrane protein NMA1128 (DUF456) n=1 Tax=Formosa agariphila (strain DSM 15362 / KCTC 12365 / LMG 23005 / KMM 3901 / M-2Alg 35-1) TaxID=1347342 RepID=T2KR03_FORAG|nr:DUF456 domain-containing protein [Formosa agariphila]CDF80866.1 conserved hypothetical membrane protein NMA1128 (DUF456) [Formosa agariphila KMM 3901]